MGRHLPTASPIPERAALEAATLNPQPHKSLAFGLLLSAFGVAWAWGVAGVPTVAAAEGGEPSARFHALPFIAGMAIAFVGAAISACALDEPAHQARTPHRRAGALRWAPLLLSLGANLLFGILLGGLPRIGLPPMGLLVAAYALALLWCLASDQLHPQNVMKLALALALALGSALAAAGLPAVPLPLWPSFVAG